MMYVKLHVCLLFKARLGLLYAKIKRGGASCQTDFKEHGLKLISIY